MASIFSKIIAGELPSHKIYEDDTVLAFLDINPHIEGQALVVPKTEVDHLWDVSDDDYSALMVASKKIALHMRQVLDVERIGVVVEGFEVPHAHIKLIPLNDTMEQILSLPPLQPSQDELAKIAQKLQCN